jgi:hypothetical protein
MLLLRTSNVPCRTFWLNATASWSRLWNMSGTPHGSLLSTTSVLRQSITWTFARTISAYLRCSVKKYLIILKVSSRSIKSKISRHRWTKISPQFSNYASLCSKMLIRPNLHLWGLVFKHSTPFSAGFLSTTLFILTWLINWSLCSNQIT